MRQGVRDRAVLLVVACATALVATLLVGAPADAAPRLGPTYRVTRVADGDTITVVVKGRSERVRLVGIDTPELGRDGSRDQCHARAARSAMQRLVRDRRVHLVKDSTQADRDAYGRLLRYVYTAKGRKDVAKSLIQGGHGREYTFKKRSYRHRASYRSAQKQAVRAKRGLWGSCSTRSSGCRIKGNISASGDKIYHVPGQQYYDQTVVTPSLGERWFCSEAEAVEAGWRRSRV